MLVCLVRAVKKLKLIGHPDKIHKKTAFIKDMFSSDLEGKIAPGSSPPYACYIEHIQTDDCTTVAQIACILACT